jgi:uncharacterized protein YqjF (DUF2071 family)
VINDRPWPIPSRPWAMRMGWRELLFAHWVVDASAVRKLIPAGLELDLFDNRCYVGAVPFLMTHVTPRLVPPIPGPHAFPEINLRTYVTTGGKPGVWFFSLDAGQKLAVRTARRFFRLPYFDAKFEIQVEGDRIDENATECTCRGFQRDLLARRARISFSAWNPRRMADGALLPLRRRCRRRDLSRRN